MNSQNPPRYQPDGKFTDGIIGGFTFSDGEKVLVYQCGECGDLCKANNAYNAHRKQSHGLEPLQFGWADGMPNFTELEGICEGDIIHIMQTYRVRKTIQTEYTAYIEAINEEHAEDLGRYRTSIDWEDTTNERCMEDIEAEVYE